MRWLIENDGSFSLLDAPVAIRRAYPWLDGAAVRPARVTVEGSTIHYALGEGWLEVTLGTGADGATVETRLGGMPIAPWRVSPVGGGFVEGADRVFRQGLGLGGPSGFVDLPLSEPAESVGLCALQAAGGAALVVASHDHARFLMQARVAAAGEPDTGTQLTAGFRTERIPLDGALTLPALHLRAAETAWDGLHETARATAEVMHARPVQQASYHWCSWYYLYQYLTEDELDAYLAGFQAAGGPLQSVQIDAGYFAAVGDWLMPNERWPSGLEAAFARIREAGYRPGIWIGPFMVGNRSRLFREHPDWILRTPEGKPFGLWDWYGEPRLWGYRDEEYYVLDTSHPDAFAYLTEVFRTFRRWGATLYKTDFMYWGLTDSSLVKRHTPGKTSVEYFRDVLAMIRREIGEESFWLGCVGPFTPFIGYADAMRIGGDVGAAWTGVFGPQNMMQETVADQYFNNVWWQNDPDAILVRDLHTKLTDTEVRSLSLWQGILGGVICTSDPLHEISPERQALWRFLAPGEPWTTELPFFGTRERLHAAVRRYPAQDAWAALLFNTTDDEVTRRIPVTALTGAPSLHAFAWGPEGAEALGAVNELLVTLPPHASALYYLSATGAPPPPGLTLGGR